MRKGFGPHANLCFHLGSMHRGGGKNWPKNFTTSPKKFSALRPRIPSTRQIVHFQFHSTFEEPPTPEPAVQPWTGPATSASPPQRRCSATPQRNPCRTWAPWMPSSLFRPLAFSAFHFSLMHFHCDAAQVYGSTQRNASSVFEIMLLF